MGRSIEKVEYMKMVEVQKRSNWCVPQHLHCNSYCWWMRPNYWFDYQIGPDLDYLQYLHWKSEFPLEWVSELFRVIKWCKMEKKNFEIFIIIFIQILLEGCTFTILISHGLKIIQSSVMIIYVFLYFFSKHFFYSGGDFRLLEKNPHAFSYVTPFSLLIIPIKQPSMSRFLYISEFCVNFTPKKRRQYLNFYKS